MIANYVNDQHDTWDQFLREFAYAIRTAVRETAGKPPAELFLGQKWIAPFQKLVMVSDETEFAVGDIKRLFEEARRNTKAKHEKWEMYHNRRRHDVQIKVNDWVLIATHPLSSATKKVVAKFKPKFEGPYRVLEVKNNDVVIWKARKRLTVNVDQVRIYRVKCDEMEIRTGSLDSNSSCHESSSFERVQRRSDESQYGYKRSRESGSGGPERKIQKGSQHRVHKRALSSNDTNSVLPKYRKRGRTEETVTLTTSGYNLRPRSGKRVESRPTMGEEDTTRTSSSQEKQRKELQPLHRRENKIRQQEYQKKSDEAHFWLNGYVNKQNCRIWSEANPQVYVETPLHPEKLTVWCALWAGGILLQKR
ncbi:uncharacterized protein TNCV_645941 [Trichonephila clavipes]|nr:uncharacterized protein TNCV_645941 [Trichonephila clavipes]